MLQAKEQYELVIEYRKLLCLPCVARLMESRGLAREHVARLKYLNSLALTISYAMRYPDANQSLARINRSAADSLPLKLRGDAANSRKRELAPPHFDEVFAKGPRVRE